MTSKQTAIDAHTKIWQAAMSLCIKSVMAAGIFVFKIDRDFESLRMTVLVASHGRVKGWPIKNKLHERLWIANSMRSRMYRQ